MAASVGAPLEAYLALSRGTLANVAALGPADALTGPVKRGDTATIERHLAALPADDRRAYEALPAEAAKLCRPRPRPSPRLPTRPTRPVPPPRSPTSCRPRG